MKISYPAGVETPATEEERSYQASYFVGKTVAVAIDRPIGARHPKHNEIVYPINYGGVEDVYAPDGELLDVYILGEDKPLSEWTGQIIAYIHRKNDVEDKLVGANRPYTKAEIASMVRFQEQFYDSTVETAKIPSKP